MLEITHLMPGTSRDESVLAAAEGYSGQVSVASPGLVAEASP